MARATFGECIRCAAYPSHQQHIAGGTTNGVQSRGPTPNLPRMPCTNGGRPLQGAVRHAMREMGLHGQQAQPLPTASPLGEALNAVAVAAWVAWCMSVGFSQTSLWALLARPGLATHLTPAPADPRMPPSFGMPAVLLRYSFRPPHHLSS